MIISKKHKIYIIIILSLLFFAGLFYFIYFNSSRNFKINALKSATEKRLKEESDKENKSYVTQRAVEMSKNVESCKLLRAKDVDSCYLDIANLNNDKKICELIGKKIVRDACYGNFTYKEAIASKDIKNCYIVASTSRDNCLSDYFREFNDTKDCSVLDDIDRQKCLDFVNSAQAYRQSDDSLCNSVVDGSMKENCKQIIKNKPLDSDKDGLSDSDERSYGTNPLNSDSDGDGVSDYDEIFKHKTNPFKIDDKGNGI